MLTLLRGPLHSRRLVGSLTALLLLMSTALLISSEWWRPMSSTEVRVEQVFWQLRIARTNCSTRRPLSYSELQQHMARISSERVAQSTSTLSVQANATAVAPAGNTGAITRLLHQSWKTAQLPERFASWSHSWCACFPDWTHVLWSDADNERFVREHYAWFLPRYRSFRRHIYRVDVVRYLYLHHFGGLYTVTLS